MYWKNLRKQSFCYKLSNGIMVFFVISYHNDVMMPKEVRKAVNTARRHRHRFGGHRLCRPDHRRSRHCRHRLQLRREVPARHPGLFWLHVLPHRTGCRRLGDGVPDGCLDHQFEDADLEFKRSAGGKDCLLCGKARRHPVEYG